MHDPRLPMLLIAGVLGIGIACPACGGGSSAAESGSKAVAEREAPAGFVTVEYDVQGMTCGGCALAAKAAVSRLEGIREVDAGYAAGAGWARVVYDPSMVSAERIAAAIEGVGYRAVPRSAP